MLFFASFLVCVFHLSNDLDVEDFDAFLEKVKARSLGGSSPFTCKFDILKLWT